MTDLTPITPGSNDVVQWLLDTALAGHLSASTVAQYRKSWAMYAGWAEDADLVPLASETLAAYRDFLVRETSLSPNTVNLRIGAIRRIVAEASTRRLVPPDLARDFGAVRGVSERALRDRLKPTAKTRLSPDQVRAICEAPDPSTVKGLRDRAFLFTLAACGGRVSEVLGLRTRDFVVLEGGKVLAYVLGKTDVERRPVPVTVEAWRHVQTWLTTLGTRPSPAYVFVGFQGRSLRPSHRPMSESAAWTLVNEYATAVGVDHVKPHDFRRFVGTQVSRRDGLVAARDVLGHRDVRSTQVYVLDGVEGGETDDLF